MLTIEMLPATQGDCLWVEYGTGDEVRRVLIDGGTTGTYKAALRARIEALPEGARRFELLVVSHIDSDHIGGLLPLVRDTKLGVEYGDIWFNGLDHLSSADEMGPAQGDMLTKVLKEKKLPWNLAFGRKAVMVPDTGALPIVELAGGLKLTLLSPTREKLADLRAVWDPTVEQAGMVEGIEATPDKQDVEEQGPPDILGGGINVSALADADTKLDGAEANGSSIALLLEFEGTTILLGADAHSQVLVASIKRLLGDREEKLRVDAVKLPHHGSKKNVTKALLEVVEGQSYFFSTNGVSHCHPNQEAVARVIAYGGARPSLFFNYRTEFNEMWDDAALKKSKHYTAEYPAPDEKGLLIELA